MELSIVLVILGLIIGTVAPLIVSMTKRNKLAEGKKVVAIARDEIIGEVIRTRQVPANLASIGHATDPWQNPLIYVPAAALVGQDLCTWLAGGTNQTGLAVCSDGDCGGKKHPNVAFVIASKGPNFNRQMEAATNHDGDVTDNELRLYAYDVQADQYAAGGDPNQPTDQFDDIIEYVSVAELLPLVQCHVTLANRSGQTICTAGTAVATGADLAVLAYNQSLGLGATSDNCVTIDATCSISYAAAKLVDTNQDGRVQLTSIPPACAMADL